MIFLFLNLDMVPRNSTPGGFAYNWQSKWVGIIVIIVTFSLPSRRWILKSLSHSLPRRRSFTSSRNPPQRAEGTHDEEHLPEMVKPCKAVFNVFSWTKNSVVYPGVVYIRWAFSDWRRIWNILVPDSFCRLYTMMCEKVFVCLLVRRFGIQNLIRRHWN